MDISFTVEWSHVFAVLLTIYLLIGIRVMLPFTVAFMMGGIPWAVAVALATPFWPVVWIWWKRK